MWGKGKGIDLLLLLTHFRHLVGFSFTCDFLRPSTNGLQDRKVANILNLQQSQKHGIVCDSGQ